MDVKNYVNIFCLIDATTAILLCYYVCPEIINV